jgi:NitT/TauT family transport system permease protein
MSVETARHDPAAERVRQRPSRRVEWDTAKWQLLLAGVVAGLLLLWEAVVSWLHLVPAAFLPPPTAIGASFVELLGREDFWAAFVFSLTNVVVGLVIAIVAGLAIGLAVGWFPVLRFTMSPLLWLLYSTPKVALAPLFILILGLGNESKIALVVLLAIFPIILNTMEGVVTVSPSLINAARVFNFRGWSFGTKVLLPATLPFSLAGIQRGAALAFTGEVLGEFLGGAGGLGHILERAAFEFHMDEAIAVVLVMVIIANATLGVVGALRRKLAPWYDAAVSTVN